MRLPLAAKRRLRRLRGACSQRPLTDLLPAGDPLFLHRAQGEPWHGITPQVRRDFDRLCHVVLRNRAGLSYSVPPDVTFGTYHNYPFRCLVESCYQSLGIEGFVVLGGEETSWSRFSRVRLLRNYLESPECTARYVVATDADDVLLINDPALLRERFLAYDCDALFCNTFVDFPPDPESCDFEALVNYQHPLHCRLCAGGLVGDREPLLVYLREITRAHDERAPWAWVDGSFFDQRAWRSLHRQHYSRIKVDHRSRIFRRYDLFRGHATASAVNRLTAKGGRGTPASRPVKRLMAPEELHRNAPDVHVHGPENTGAVLIALATERLGLDSLADCDVLDVGCGVRFTQAILNRGIPIKSYTGIDVHSPLIEYLQREADDPRFSFAHWDVHNSRYNPTGEKLTRESSLPVTGSFDVIWLFSVFTHLEPTDSDALLAILRRHVRPTGRLLFTAFLDEPSGTFVDRVPESPLAHASYSEESMRALVDANGWRVVALNLPSPERFIRHQLVCRPMTAPSVRPLDDVRSSPWAPDRPDRDQR